MAQVTEGGVNVGDMVDEQDLDDEMAEDDGDEEDDFWLGKLKDFISPCQPIFRKDSMESPTPPVASLEAPRPDSPPPVQEEETSLPSEDGLYDKEVSSEETPAETDDTLSIVKEEVKEEVQSPEKTPPPVAKKTRVRSGLTPEPEGPGQAKKTRRKPAKRNVGSEPKVNNPRAGGAKRKAAKAASAAVTAAAIQDNNDPDENRNSSGAPPQPIIQSVEMVEVPISEEDLDRDLQQKLDALPLNLTGVNMMFSSFMKTPEDLSERLKLLVQEGHEKKKKKKMSNVSNFDHSRKCPLCGADSANTKELNKHIKEAHGVEGVVCPHCSKILAKNCTLSRHIEQVHFNLQIHKPAKCDQCDKVFSKKGHLDRHVKTIHEGKKEQSQPCPYCGKVFSTKSSLEPHIQMVHQGMRKKCPECGKVLSDLWKHMRTMHGQYRRRAKISKEEALTNNLVPSDAKNRVNVKDIDAAKAVPTFTAEVDNPNAIELVQVRDPADDANKKKVEHKLLPEAVNPLEEAPDDISDNVEENKVQTKKRGAKGKGGGGGRRKKAQKC